MIFHRSGVPPFQTRLFAMFVPPQKKKSREDTQIYEEETREHKGKSIHLKLRHTSDHLLNTLITIIDQQSCVLWTVCSGFISNWLSAGSLVYLFSDQISRVFTSNCQQTKTHQSKEAKPFTTHHGLQHPSLRPRTDVRLLSKVKGTRRQV